MLIAEYCDRGLLFSAVGRSPTECLFRFSSEARSKPLDHRVRDSQRLIDFKILKIKWRFGLIESIFEEVDRRK